jgi:hypothetical protein
MFYIPLQISVKINTKKKCFTMLESYFSDFKNAKKNRQINTMELVK